MCLLGQPAEGWVATVAAALQKWPINYASWSLPICISPHLVTPHLPFCLGSQTTVRKLFGNYGAKIRSRQSGPTWKMSSRHGKLSHLNNALESHHPALNSLEFNFICSGQGQMWLQCLNIFILGTTMIPTSSQQFYLARSKTVACSSTGGKTRSVGLVRWCNCALCFRLLIGFSRIILTTLNFCLIQHGSLTSKWLSRIPAFCCWDRAQSLPTLHQGWSVRPTEYSEVVVCHFH